ncbi:hypothetical protein HAX54_018537 [Datura stramonium]|uniref:Uncharacterized protein n=1 Tax=Datura stramonium TaxID=4076 RepID=A0ABS8UMH0_DATST|nr:hypothetical protein [Datura stramonium]
MPTRGRTQKDQSKENKTQATELQAMQAIGKSGGAKKVAELLELGEEDVWPILNKHSRVGSLGSAGKAVLGNPTKICIPKVSSGSNTTITSAPKQIAGCIQKGTKTRDAESGNKVEEKDKQEELQLVDAKQWNAMLKGNALAGVVGDDVGVNKDKQWTYVGKSVKRKSAQVPISDAVETTNEFGPLGESASQIIESGMGNMEQQGIELQIIFCNAVDHMEC